MPHSTPRFKPSKDNRKFPATFPLPPDRTGWHDDAMTDGDLQTREAALVLLQAVTRKGQALDTQLDRLPEFQNLDGRDRGFAHNLVATTLRRLGQIDAVIDAFVDRPLAKGANHVTDVLRLGLAQLLFTGVAPHAAVDTAVRLVRTSGRGQFDKLVNAVLRRAQREAEALVQAQDAASLNTPAWLWQSWEVAYGGDICRRIADAHLAPAPALDLSVKSDPERWAQALGGDIVGAGTVRLRETAKVTELTGYDTGAWWVQDAAAALPVKLLGNNIAGIEVLDLCAAPGGKTAQLAAAGARVTAVDRSPARMTRLQENLGRLGLSAEMVVGDAAKWAPETLFDAILLDAPCSATGTIRRHPDLPHIKRLSDVNSLVGVQSNLLARAGDWLRPGGSLIFVTCSLQPEEGPDQVTAFLAARPDYRRVAADLTSVGIDLPSETLNSDGDLRTLPCHLSAAGGMDGFYAAKLVKAA